MSALTPSTPNIRHQTSSHQISVDTRRQDVQISKHQYSIPLRFVSFSFHSVLFSFHLVLVLFLVLFLFYCVMNAKNNNNDDDNDNDNASFESREEAGRGIPS